MLISIYDHDTFFVLNFLIKILPEFLLKYCNHQLSDLDQIIFGMGTATPDILIVDHRKLLEFDLKASHIISIGYTGGDISKDDIFHLFFEKEKLKLMHRG